MKTITTLPTSIIPFAVCEQQKGQHAKESVFFSPQLLILPLTVVLDRFRPKIVKLTYQSQFSMFGIKTFTGIHMHDIDIEYYQRSRKLNNEKDVESNSPFLGEILLSYILQI